MRVDGSFRGLTENVPLTEGQDPAQNAGQGNFVDRQGRFAASAPHLLVGIGEECVPHFRETSSGVGAIFCGDPFCAKVLLCHSYRASLVLAYVDSPQPNSWEVLRCSVTPPAIGRL